MFKRFSRQSATQDSKKKQLWGKDFDIVSKGLDEGQVVNFVTDLLKQRKESAPAAIRSVLKMAVVSAERITEAIQKKAKTEAEDEAARIIAQANQKVAKTAGKPEKENKKPLEVVLPENSEVSEEATETSKATKVPEEATETSKATKVPEETTETLRTTKVPEEATETLRTTKVPEETTETLKATKVPEETTEISEEKTKTPEGVTEISEEAPETLPENSEVLEGATETSGETTGLPAQAQSETTEEPVEETPQLPSETGESSTAGVIESILEGRQLVEVASSPEQPRAVLSKQDTQSLYTGEVELTITKPVDPKMVARLYNYLQTTPEIKFVRTSGSWERGTTIIVALDKPIALISVLSSKIPEADVVPERPERDGFISGKKGVRSINLALRKRAKTD